MLIDRTHRSWALGTTIVFLAATVLYLLYARTWPGGASGRTWPGMLFGVAGSLLMLYAGLIAVRKRVIRLRIGTVRGWLRGHIWMSLLSVPIIFYHAAFRWGGTIEVLLWWTLAVVIVSGIFGLALQNVLPRMMHLQLPDEAIADQFAEVCQRLVAATDAEVVASCGVPAMEAALALPPGEEPSLADAKTWLAHFYLRNIRPFLEFDQSSMALFSNASQAEATFDRVGSSLPAECQTTLELLSAACSERQQLARQQRYHRLLHIWLRIHVPGAIVLLVFAVIHIISALYY
jgi:hypothetical protein